MGCSGSKADDLPLVVRCRERKELIRAAANHRYALAAAHVSYFRSLKDVGDALRKFVEEEFITNSNSSSSSFSSSSLVLPPNSKVKHSNDEYEEDDEDGGEEDSHIHLTDSSSEEDIHQTHHVHKGFNNEEEEEDVSRFNGHGQGFTHNVHTGFQSGDDVSGFNGYRQGFGGEMMNDPYANPYSYPYPYQQPATPYGQQYMDPRFYSNNSNVHYMKKSAPATRTVIQESPPDPGYGYSGSYWTSPPTYGYHPMGNNESAQAYGYSSMGNYDPMGNNEGAQAYGYSSMGNFEAVKKSPEKEAPPPPSPKASAWDFFNPFDELGGGHSGYYQNGAYGIGSNYSSPDSTEVREREGIPDLEEETENEMYKDPFKEKITKANGKNSSREKTPRSRTMPGGRRRDGVSRSVPMNKSENSSGSVPWSSSGESDKPSMSMPPRYNGESGHPSMPPQYREEGAKPSMRPYYEETENPTVPPQYSKEAMPSHYNEGTGNPSMPPQYSEEGAKPSTSSRNSKGKSRAYQSPIREMEGSVCFTDEESSPEIVSVGVDEGSVKKKGVTFDMEGTSKQDGDSSLLSSVTLLSPHGTRDLQDVVAEIRDEFETASTYGKEVAVMLEVGKLPYEPTFLKALLSRVLYLISPSMSIQDAPSFQSSKLASRTMKSAKFYFEDVGEDVNVKACNLSSILDKLYIWEKKLYKEVKGEERLRVLYEKQRKRLRMLDDEGAESSKIDVAQASVRRLLTKLDVSIKKINSISSRIHKLRDEELQPQVSALIQGLIRMWKAMFKCHRKQFQAIMDSKMRKLKANTSLQTDSTSRATTKLERELHAWCESFNDWIHFQKSYVESLNGWLLQCLQYIPEQTADGPIPYSPGQLGAPPIFVICNDWHQALDAIPETKVSNAMNTFATTLRQLWEKQDEEGRQRLKKEYLSKDYERELRTRRMKRGELDNERDTMSNKTGLSVVQSDSGISRLDDLKSDLDFLRERYAEESKKHKDAMKLVQDAASSSLQGGLIPIFKALENFSSEALKAHEHVRLQQPRQ